MEKIALILRYLKHYLTAVDEHGVHSPFLFKILTEGIYDKTRFASWDVLEDIRRRLLHNETVLDVTDLGAGSKADGKSSERKISFICRSFAKSPRLCRVLFKITRQLQPKQILELGTSLGMSTMYLASAFNEARVTTIEGCPNTAEIAKENFKAAGLQNIESVTGDFQKALPTVLEKMKHFDLAYVDGNHTYDATVGYFNTLCRFATNGSMIVFDDIHWSEGMERAWNEIQKDKRITMSVDLFHFGLVFFDNRLSKEHFKIRL